MLKGKKIVLGVTGSIAAYKAAMLLRLLVKEGAEVQVVMTPSAKEFITPLTLSALSGRPVLCDFFKAQSGEWNSHVELGLWADAMVIAPATASTIGKMAAGIADNLLVTTYLSMKAPVFVAPAMDLDMYAHPATQSNIALLQERGNRVIEAASGELASHLIGKGRMEEPENIVEVLENFFNTGKPLAGKKVMLTAGPTYERIDPVRFIGNFSTGKMGYSLADAAARLGAEVTLISGPVSVSAKESSVKVVNVESAREMCEVAEKAFVESDIAIMCAAVADYAPANALNSKIKRETDEIPTIQLVKNPDIAATLGEKKRQEQTLVGFALETDNGIENAKRKIQSKNLDMIVLNMLSDPGAGFGTDTNRVTIITCQGETTSLPLMQKSEVAVSILEHIVKLHSEK